jgi:AcrR family transcriptional regulator
MAEDHEDPAGTAPGVPMGEADVVRRAPFSDNPRVGARGQRTQQRILDAALQVFGEKGYHQCSVDRIARLAGCSRVSFYQYFSSKEDLFRHLSGQVARQLGASTEALGAVTADAAGWGELRAWVGRHGDVYGRYEPVFRAFHEAVEADEAVAGGSLRIGRRNFERVRARLAPTDLPPRLLDAVTGLLLASMARTQQSGRGLRSAAPEVYTRDRIDVALTDVMHRSLFGRLPGVNDHPGGPAPPRIPFGPVMTETLRSDGDHGLTASGRRTLEQLMAAGQEVFVRRGYHAARVDDVVEAAGVSHGAFYRYFSNKDELAHRVAARSIGRVSTAVEELGRLPRHDGEAAHAALRGWARRYSEAYAAEAAVVQVWVDASHDSDSLRPDSVAVLDWGRRQVARFLRPRGYGDVDGEAVVMLAVLSALGNSGGDAASIDGAVHIIERGLLDP